MLVIFAIRRLVNCFLFPALLILFVGVLSLGGSGPPGRYRSETGMFPPRIGEAISCFDSVALLERRFVMITDPTRFGGAGGAAI
jgi:hypothetical protein